MKDVCGTPGEPVYPLNYRGGLPRQSGGASGTHQRFLDLSELVGEELNFMQIYKRNQYFAIHYGAVYTYFKRYYNLFKETIIVSDVIYNQKIV